MAKTWVSDRLGHPVYRYHRQLINTGGECFKSNTVVIFRTILSNSHLSHEEALITHDRGGKISFPMGAMNTIQHWTFLLPLINNRLEKLHLWSVLYIYKHYYKSKSMH